MLQRQLPPSLATMHWYSPVSEGSHLVIWRLNTETLSVRVYFLPLRISLLFFSQVTLNGDVPITSHSSSTSLSFTTSAGFNSLTKVGGSKCSKGRQRLAYSREAPGLASSTAKMESRSSNKPLTFNSMLQLAVPASLRASQT